MAQYIFYFCFRGIRILTEYNISAKFMVTEYFKNPRQVVSQLYQTQNMRVIGVKAILKQHVGTCHKIFCPGPQPKPRFC